MSKTLKLDCPGLLGLSQSFRSLRLRNKPPWCWDSAGLWDCPDFLELSRFSGTVPKLRTVPSFSLRLKNKHYGVGTLGLLDSPKISGLSWAFGTVPKFGTVPSFWVCPKLRDSPKGLGLSRASGTILKSRDCPRLLVLCQRPRVPGF